MTYLKQVEQLSGRVLALTEVDVEKRAFILVAIDDPEEEVEANTMMVTAGSRENVQVLIEALLGVDELAPLVQKAMLNIIAREQERNFDIDDLLKILKNEN